MALTSSYYILLVIFIMTISTFFCRSLPFFAFKKLAQHPIFLFIGRTLPPMIMILLVLYCLSDVKYAVKPYGLNELIASTIAICLHGRFNNALLSIGISTAVYMILKQTGVLMF